MGLEQPAQYTKRAVRDKRPVSTFFESMANGLERTMIRKRHKIYSARDLLLLKDDPDRWIVENAIPKIGRTLVYGKGGANKSTIIFDLCIAISAGTHLLRQFKINTYGPVLLVSTEGSIFDNKNRIMAHARAHGINPAALPLFYCQQPFALDDPLDIKELDLLIQELKPVLVVLDPLDSFFSGDENSSKETKMLRRAVDQFIDSYKLAFIIIHHESKIGGSPRGSSAWQGWADAILYVNKKRKKLGLPEALDIVSVTGQKQRNGREGLVFTAVPLHDNVLNEITFSLIQGADHSQVVMEYWKYRCYIALCEANAAMTDTMLAQKLQTRQEKISECLLSLEAEGKIAKDSTIERTFGDNRRRQFPAWRVLRKIDIVKLMEYMVKQEEQYLEEELQAYQIDPKEPTAPEALELAVTLQQQGASSVNPPNPGGIYPAGVPARSRVSSILH
jgi:hypothetical protein